MPKTSRIVRLLGRRVRSGSVLVEEGADRWVVGHGDPVVRVCVSDDRAWSSLLAKGSVGLATSYAEGWWEADDLTSLVRVLLGATEGLRRGLDAAARAVAPVVDPIGRLRQRSARDDRRFVQAHYDLPGEIFEVMLDESMAYSCAVFEHPGSSLTEAQEAKFDRICRKLRLQADDEVVEIGTGWGGFALHAAARYGCRVVTTTVSDAQREVASKRVADAGLGDRVTVLGLDYRQLEGRYDKLVSIEMIEAVDWRSHDAFFAACSKLLRNDGLMALQAITMADRSFDRAKLHDDFVRALIFPGGCIPSVASIAGSVTRSTDLAVVDLEDIGRHYAETLRRWDVALRAGRPRLDEAGIETRLQRLFHLYLCYCEAAFLERHISDVQIVLAKPRWRPQPPLALRPC